MALIVEDRPHSRASAAAAAALTNVHTSPWEMRRRLDIERVARKHIRAPPRCCALLAARAHGIGACRRFSTISASKMVRKIALQQMMNRRIG